MRKQYSVTVAGRIHEVTVSLNVGGTRYVSGPTFGVSRDIATADDRDAIRKFLGEKSLVVEKIVGEDESGTIVKWDPNGWSGTRNPNTTRPYAVFVDGEPLRDSGGRIRTFKSREAATSATKILSKVTKSESEPVQAENS